MALFDCSLFEIVFVLFEFMVMRLLVDSFLVSKFWNLCVVVFRMSFKCLRLFTFVEICGCVVLLNDGLV